MLQEVKTINWEEFVDKYHPVKNHIDKYASYNNCMFETFGEELAYIVNLSNNEESKKSFIYHVVKENEFKDRIINAINNYENNSYYEYFQNEITTDF